jgi:hypothetical protein
MARRLTYTVTRSDIAAAKRRRGSSEPPPERTRLGATLGERALAKQLQRLEKTGRSWL